MKRIKKYSFCIILFMWVFIACKKDSANLCEVGNCIIERPSDTYDYPVKGGTPEWAAFTIHQQMEDACQVPTGTFAGMSTKGLIQTCVDYPLLGDLLLNVGVNVTGITNHYMTSFSGLIELSRRADMGSLMLDRYKIMNPGCTKCMPVDFSSKFSAFEMIIGHDSIQGKMSSSQKKILVNEAINKYQQKKNLGFDYYAYYALSTPLYVCAKVMLSGNYQPFVQLYDQNFNLQLFVSKLLWPADLNETDALYKQILDNAILFSK